VPTAKVGDQVVSVGDRYRVDQTDDSLLVLGEHFAGIFITIVILLLYVRVGWFVAWVSDNKIAEDDSKDDEEGTAGISVSATSGTEAVGTDCSVAETKLNVFLLFETEYSFSHSLLTPEILQLPVSQVCDLSMHTLSTKYLYVVF
jgi:hypothetical protein